jgi:hypothetical protein
MSLVVHLRVVILQAIAVILPTRAKGQAINVSVVVVALCWIIIARFLCSTAAFEIARHVDIGMRSSIV